MKLKKGKKKLPAIKKELQHKLCSRSTRSPLTELETQLTVLRILNKVSYKT